MSRNKLIGIAAACIVVVIVVVMATTGEPTPPAEANSPASDFLRVGESYEGYSSTVYDIYHTFTVLKIINDKWILVESWDEDEAYWVNTDQLIRIVRSEED